MAVAVAVAAAGPQVIIRGVDSGPRSYAVVDVDDRGVVVRWWSTPRDGPGLLVGLPPVDVWAVEAVESYGRIRAAQIVALAEAAGAAVHQCRTEGARLAGRPRRRDVLAAAGISATMPAAIADAHLSRQVTLRLRLPPDWPVGNTHVVDAAAVALWAARELLAPRR